MLVQQDVTTTATIFTINTEATYDWHASQWTVPINGGISQLIKLGDQPVSLGLMGTWFAERPDTAPGWGHPLRRHLPLPEKLNLARLRLKH